MTTTRKHPDIHKKKDFAYSLENNLIHQKSTHKSRTGTLSPNSPKNHHNPLHRSFLAFKTWHIFLDFNRSFFGILGDKTANIPIFGPFHTSQCEKLIDFIPEAISKIECPLLEKIGVFCWGKSFPFADFSFPFLNG